MAICTTRKSSQSGDFELLSIPAVQKTEQGFHHNQFPKFSFSQGVFHVLERYIGFEPWDLYPLTIKCYRKCLQNYKGTIFGVTWTEKYRFKIINAVTDEPKGTIFSSYKLENLRINLLDRTISFFSLVSQKDMRQSILHINHGEFRSSDKLRFTCG